MTVDQTFRENRPQHAAQTSAGFAAQEGRSREPLPGRTEHRVRAKHRDGADPPIPWVPPPGSTAEPLTWPRIYPGL
jgi:hypothetical protein